MARNEILVERYVLATRLPIKGTGQLFAYKNCSLELGSLSA